MPTFDIVSELDKPEIDNALQQTQKELATRFDFRGTDSEAERTEEGIVLRSHSQDRIEAVLQVLRDKFAKRKLSQRVLDPQKLEPGSKGHFKQLIKLKAGISKEHAKQITQFIKDGKYKVSASIQGEQLRITGKKKDDLQEVIAAVRAKDFEVDLQFTNFRD
ncbi:MAG TPA: YajQ family cyclic di-GMP-binding protein [Polyangiales bacterium]|nr:YajQ family cyclic di-GMP-binding protein [Polyangiales bacterium]